MISLWEKNTSKKSGKTYYKNRLAKESKWKVPDKNGILIEFKKFNNTFIIYIPDEYLISTDSSLYYSPIELDKRIKNARCNPLPDMASIKTEGLDWNPVAGAKALSEKLKVHVKCACEAARKGTSRECDMSIVRRRVGSSSTAGEVYEVSMFGALIAAKLMPILSDKDIATNESEIQIAIEASHLVVSRQSMHFPLVFGYSICNDAEFNKDSLFRLKAAEYATLKSITSKLSPMKAKRVEAEVRSGRVSVEDIAKQHGVPMRKTGICNILLSELALMDLGVYLQRRICMKQSRWIDILLQIVSAIDDMQSKLGIVHNDLHLGNVLMQIPLGRVYETASFVCLVHDFGKSERVTDWTPEYYAVDLVKFIDSYTRVTEMPDSLRVQLIYALDVLRFWPKLESPVSWIRRLVKEMDDMVKCDADKSEDDSWNDYDPDDDYDREYDPDFSAQWKEQHSDGED